MLKYPVLCDAEDHGEMQEGYNSIPAQEWGIGGVPASFLIDPQGVIVAAELRGAKLAGTLDFYLNSPRPIYGLRGASKLPCGWLDLQFSRKSMSPEMEDSELELYLYKANLSGMQPTKENVWHIVRYRNDLPSQRRYTSTGDTRRRP